jgi:hypothetical protein
MQLAPNEFGDELLRIAAVPAAPLASAVHCHPPRR